AEEATIFKGKVETEHSGFSGSAYVNYDNVSDSYVQWNVTLSQAASVELGFRYANGTSQGRPMAILVNGVLVTPSLSFDTTGAWNSWATQSLIVTLVPG